MLLLRLFHRLSGFVCFAAKGGFPERFLNLCTGSGIPVWDIRPHGDTLCGKTHIRSYLRLHGIARRSGVHLRITDKKGLPFFLHRHKQRFGLLIGGAVFLAMLALLSSRIWIIDVQGNRLLTDDAVRAALQEIGIVPGISPHAFRAAAAEQRLLSTLDRAAWIALNVDGSVLHVEIRETALTDPAEDYTHPCHIVAAKDGFLRRLDAYEGVECATLRTAVQAGQLLVSGIVEHSDGSVTLHHAKGYAEAETQRTLTCSLPPDLCFPAVQSSRFRITLHLFTLHIPLGDPRPANGALFFRHEAYALADGMRLPVSCTVSRNTFFDGDTPLSAARQKLLLHADFGRQTAMECRGCTILQADVRESANSITGTFRLLENITQTAPIQIE